jgi:hypothetical protein
MITTNTEMNSTINGIELEHLPYSVYFVNKNFEKFKDLMGCEESTSPKKLEQYYEHCVDGLDIWSAQTYIHLKQRGLNVYLIPKPIPGQICVIPYHYLAIRDMAFDSYVVACRLDSPRPELCEQQVVINPLNVLQPTDHFLPHWPQPTLKPRDHLRGTTIKTLDFKGGKLNLAQPFQSREFHKQLNELGVTLLLTSTKASPQSVEQYHCWADYTQSDVILAVRNLTEYDFTLKPAVKLINAWHAGCPALLGAEPAYQALRKSELDYIEVRTPEDVIQALKRLQQDPDLYKAMIENGYERAKEFSTDQIALYWRDLLAGPIANSYEQWLRQSALQKTIGRPIQFIQRAIRHKKEFKHYLYHRDHGVRPYGND